MYIPHADVLSFGEIGGVGEMTYRTVRFPRYELVYENGKSLLCPRYDSGTKLIDPVADTLLTGQGLLVSLCNLYRAINNPDCEGNYIVMIADWCSEHTHPYEIDSLYDLVKSVGNDYDTFSPIIMKDGIFAVEDFMHDLEALYHTTCFHHAILQLINENDSYARALYYEGRFSDGYSFFEKYKRPAITIQGREHYSDDLLEEMQLDLKAAEPESDVPDSDVPSSEHPFLQNPLHDLEYLHATLISLFPEFRMKLRKDPKTKRIMFAADVYSVFDLAWYALSRSVAHDTPDYDLNPDSMFSDGTPLACMHCGNFFFRKGPRQKYCSNGECQAARQRKNQRNKRERAKIQEQQ